MQTTLTHPNPDTKVHDPHRTAAAPYCRVLTVARSRIAEAWRRLPLSNQKDENDSKSSGKWFLAYRKALFWTYLNSKLGRELGQNCPRDWRCLDFFLVRPPFLCRDSWREENSVVWCINFRGDSRGPNSVTQNLDLRWHRNQLEQGKKGIHIKLGRKQGFKRTCPSRWLYGVQKLYIHTSM